MTISLAGPWVLHSALGEAIGPCPIPGDVHSALVAAGRIPDPLIRRNEADIQWVGDAEWEIRRRFTLDPAATAGKWAVLDLEFVDTFATVTVNGFDVGACGSTFMRYRFDVTDALRSGENEIVIRFLPAAAEAHGRAERQPFPIPWSASNNRIANLNMIRKPQCHAGWDWGPCIMVMGLYAEPKLRFFDAARIEHAVIRQEHREDGTVKVTAEVELAAIRSAKVPVAFTFGKETVTAEAEVTAAGGGMASLSIDLYRPELWWPAGQGRQVLHDAAVIIPGDRVEKRIGLRTIALVAEPDAAGVSMAFRVNGRDVFAKGANWIPADALPTRITPERIRRLLAEAAAANMNMIRVWGGGFYEFDAFYDACDELGLMVWQDMMFACSQYPSTPEFLAEVDAEVRYQVKRLASHASIALWCGDNEIVGSLTWHELSRTYRDRYLVNYDRFNRAVERAVLDSDRERRFWPSSPCAGSLDYGDAWHDDKKGDMHFWSVWHEGRDFEHYYSVKPRFCSEFGFQSFPTMGAIRRFAEPAQWNVTSPVMEFHQRDRAGNSKILETMTRYFRMANGFEGFVYLSQLQQALAIETAVRYWRSLKPHSMGTLYWQLNDVWPAVSWSSLDYYLAWKTLHYHARRFYAPVALAARVEEGRLVVSVVSDLAQTIGIVARVQRVSLDGRVLAEDGFEAELPPDRAVEMGSLPAEAGDEHFYVLDARRRGELAYDPLLRLVVLPDKPKRFDLPVATVTVEAIAKRPGTFAFSSDRPAFYVKPEAAGLNGAFDDASFLLLPGEKRTVTFRSYDGRMPGPDDVSVFHLAATYQ
jgi:beta-mannosidase